MLRRPLYTIMLAVLVLSLFWLEAWGKKQGFPKPVGYVNDFADMISPQAEILLDRIAREVKAKTGAEIAVVTIETTGGVDIEEYSVDLFMEWGIGEKGKDNGVLILVAAKDRNLWIKTGYGLEGAIPDAEAHVIYREVLRPGFKAGQYDPALVTATKMLAELIMAESGQTFAFSDSVPDAFMFGPGTPGARRARISPIFALLFALFPFFVFTALRMAAVRGGRGRRYGGFWIGGIGGSSGGFGGGFGGFGGGSCGGGGAGGGW